jgi:hypothetical protein
LAVVLGVPSSAAIVYNRRVRRDNNVDGWEDCLCHVSGRGCTVAVTVTPTALTAGDPVAAVGSSTLLVLGLLHSGR